MVQRSAAQSDQTSSIEHSRMTMQELNTNEPKWAPTDEALMSAAGRGDLGAFEHLVLRHQSAAWNAAFRFVGDEAEAEDIAQEGFLRILAAAPRYEPTAKFRTYLYRVITRLCMDHAQKKRPIYVDELPDAVDAGPSPYELLTTVERRRHVQRALDALPVSQRMVVILRFYEGLAYAEIATCLGTTTKAVERMLARARDSLENRLEEFLK
jgi:RNA polymerase sigma-70 factor (ECF subfamily)